MHSRFHPGDAVILRSIPEPDRVGTVRSFTVVRDEPDLLALSLAPGNPCLRRKGVRGGPTGRILIVDSGEHEAWHWDRTGVLLLYHPGDAHTTNLFWSADGNTLLVLYIDLIVPLQRTPLGFDTRDLVLDVTMPPDRSSWEWKDEEEFAWFVETGRFTREHADEIRAEGRRAVERLIGTDLYCEWESWHPDSSWARPTIPDGWKTLR
jgi:hypothetical protein